MLELLNSTINAGCLTLGTYFVARTAFYAVALRACKVTPISEARLFAFGCVLVVGAICL